VKEREALFKTLRREGKKERRVSNPNRRGEKKRVPARRTKGS